MLHEPFAYSKTLAELNLMNRLFPDIISIALQTDTSGMSLTHGHLQKLIETQIAKVWVGRRALAFDIFPAMGKLFNDKGEITNGACATHWGSGGVSNGPIAAYIALNSLYKKPSEYNNLENSALKFGRSNREAGPLSKYYPVQKHHNPIQ